MHLNDPINKNAPHSLRDLRLVVHVLVLRLIHHFSGHEVLHYVSGEFNNILRVRSILFVTLSNCLLKMHSAPSLKIIIDLL